MPETDAQAGRGPGDVPATKQAVYEAALRLFARNGFAATGMRELSREAGVNLATVNYFYGSKKGLLKAILEDYFTGIVAVLDKSLAGDDGPEAKLRRTAASVARYFDAHADQLIVALTELPHDDPDITEFKAEHFKRISAIVQAGLGEATSHAPVAVIGPALVGLAASRFLFLPVLEKALPKSAATLDSGRYPDLIAQLFVDGFAGMIAAGGEGRDA